MKSVGLTNIGLKREVNQDTFFINRESNLYIVADGMGGHQIGEVASKIAVKIISEVFQNSYNKNNSIAKLLTNAVKRANDAIYQKSKKIGHDCIMGTTLTTAVIENDIAYIAHVGDSRAYLIDDNTITAVTLDHSYVGELVRSGSLSKEEAVRHPKRNLLTRAIGTEPEVNVDLLEIQFKKGNYLILCSDGLSNSVSEGKIQEIILKAPNLKSAAKELINEALKKGGNDNITVVVVKNE